jgi:hypothetical protein
MRSRQIYAPTIDCAEFQKAAQRVGLARPSTVEDGGRWGVAAPETGLGRRARPWSKSGSGAHHRAANGE